MALENLVPVTRREAILSGLPLEPVTREEYFLEEAVGGGLPEYGDTDAGKVLTIADDGAVEWKTPQAVYDFVIVDDGGDDLILQSGNYDAVRAKVVNGVPVLGVFSNQSKTGAVGIEFTTNIELSPDDITLTLTGGYLVWDDLNNLFWD